MLIEALLLAAFAPPTILDSSRIDEGSVARSDTLELSSHSERVIRVNGVSLDMLDWGGKGDLLLFLPGYGDTAHIFDDLAPAFTDHFHVVAITPRGFPPSGAPDTGYTIAQIADDVRAVMDSLGASTAVLAGHSISGAVITQFGIAHHERLRAAIYLDASFDFGAAYRRSHRPGKLSPGDTTSAAYRAWQNRYNDSKLSRSIRAAVAANERAWQIDSADAARRMQLVSPLANEVRSRPHEPWRISAPALALCAGGSFDRGLGWLTPDSARWREAHIYYEAVTKEKRDECERFATRNPHAKVLMLDSGHYVFIDARDEVVHAMRSFLAALRRARTVEEYERARKRRAS